MNEEIENKILDLITEDDYGLWEILWRILGSANERDISYLADKTKNIVGSLIENGFAVLVRRNGSCGLSNEIDHDSAQKIILLDSCWKEPESIDNDQLLLRSTNSGDELYKHRTTHSK